MTTTMTINEQDARFDEIHGALAEVGLCDTTGGYEYTHVKAEWIEQGRPHLIAGFIEERSNVGCWNTQPRGLGNETSF